jgi:hypothetical protein
MSPTFTDYTRAWPALFTSHTAAYDILVYLDEVRLTRRAACRPQQDDAAVESAERRLRNVLHAERRRIRANTTALSFPIVDYDPLQEYVEEIEVRV